MKSEANKHKAKWYRMSEAEEMAAAKVIADRLTRTYPGYGWVVAVNDGVVDIWINGLDVRRGYRMKTTDLTGGMREVDMAGGELLERYRQPRGWKQETAWRSVQRDLRGNAIPDM